MPVKPYYHVVGHLKNNILHVEMNFNIGDSVKVKPGIKEPDLEEFEIGDWQGRIVEIDTKSDNENILITIEWDSISLRELPDNYIEQSEIDGLDWQKITLYGSELEKSTSRDKKENVKKAQDKLSKKFHWASFGEEGLRISKILGNANPHNEMKCLQKWVDHLDKKLTFPIDAFVSESEDNLLIKDGDKVIIKSLPHIVDLYGIIASIRLGGKRYEFPLCDLEVIDRSKPDFQLIDDYNIWFSNKCT
jgi:hypothetical protein